MAIYGINKKLQIGPEASWGTEGTPDLQLSFLRETLKQTTTAEPENTLMVSKGVRNFLPATHSVAGDIEVETKPGEAGKIYKWALGKEENAPVLVSGSTGAYEHTLTCLAVGETQPSKTIVVDRGVAIKNYIGCRVDKISVSAAEKQSIKTTIAVKGKSEGTGTLNGALTSNDFSSYTFIGGVIKFDGVNYGKIYKFDLNLSNSLSEDKYPNGSGAYPDEHIHGEKVIELDIEAEYDSTTEAINTDNYKAGEYIKIEAEFVSPKEIEAGFYHKIKFICNAVRITDVGVNISGKEMIPISIKGVATEHGDVEIFEVVITDDIATVY